MKEEKQECTVATEELAGQIVESTTEVVPVIPVTANHTSVVIPYCKEFAQGKELMYALRSWNKNCCFPADFVVIGDKEEWFSDEIHFIECPRVSDNPSVDTYHKLKVALESDLVTDDFIWTNDDIYDCLKQLGAACQNYGTHTPVMFNKASWLGLIAKLDEQITQGMLYTSIYFNLQQPQVTAVTLDWRKDPFLLPVVSQNPSTEVVKSLLPKMFLNNARSGYSPWLESFLDKEFPAKCLFEQ